jgi:hypothetical protein
MPPGPKEREGAPRVMAKRTRREAFQQAWEDWQRFLEALQSAQQRWNRWLDEELPSEPTGGELAAPPRMPPAKRGRAPILTDDEVERLQTAYCEIRADKPARTQKRVFADLRELLPPDKRRISDATLRDHIVPPPAQK